MWFYNMSSSYPEDRNGKSATELYSTEIAQQLHANSHFDGLAFDVVYMQPRREKFDLNNNSIPDNQEEGSSEFWVKAFIISCMT